MPKPDNPEIPDDIRELGETLGMSYALRLKALGSPALARVAETLGKLRDIESLRESQNSGCQNGQCRRPFLDDLLSDVTQKKG